MILIIIVFMIWGKYNIVMSGCGIGCCLYGFVRRFVRFRVFVANVIRVFVFIDCCFNDIFDCIFECLWKVGVNI